MKAKSINAGKPEDLKEAIDNVITDGFTPTLAIVFISVKQDRKAVHDLLNDVGLDIFGVTSSGEFIEGHQSEGEIALLLLDINRSCYKILLEEIGDRSPIEASDAIAEKGANTFANPAFILSGTSFTGQNQWIEGSDVLNGFLKRFGNDLKLFGGMAGDDLTLNGTFVFTNNQFSGYAIIAIAFDEDKVSMHGMAISGWKPMGVTRTVTKSDGRLIYEIDNQPALEMYLRFLGKEVKTEDETFDFFDEIGIHYPFQIEREGREPMMCAPMGYDRDEKALICESNVPTGSKFRFSTPPDFDFANTITSKAEEIKSEVNEEAEALLIFSCVGRFSSLGPIANEENEGLANVWKAPMAGFYTYGEFGLDVTRQLEFHSTTNSWVVLKEK